jgi:hypothetical protein
MGNKEVKDIRSEYLKKFDRFNLNAVSDHELEWIADQLLEWASLEDSVTLLGFCADNGIAQTSLYQWEQRNSKLRSAMSTAKSMVGARREKMALLNKFNAGIVNRTMGVYDDRVRAYDTEMRLLGSQEDKAQTVNVMMHHMPETDVVPKKKSREDG